MSETSQAQQLFELVVAALQSHERLEAVEREFQIKLEVYWADVQKNIDHGVLLAKLEWERDARRYERTNDHLERENARLAADAERKSRAYKRKLELLTARLVKERSKAQKRKARR